MTGLEITLLILGVTVFVVSFLIPQKKDSEKEMTEINTDQIKEAVEGQVADAKIRVEEMVDETVSYSVEKTERALERLTNDKIGAVSEYADTVLKDINKNHKEVMFLYDMLNEKHESLVETAKEVTETTKAAEETIAKAEEIPESLFAPITLKTIKAEKIINPIESMNDTLNAMAPDFEPGVEWATVVEEKPQEETAKTVEKVETVAEEPAKKNIDTNKNAVANKEKAVVEKKPQSEKKPKAKSAEKEELNIQFAGNDHRNNNEKILALYKEGKSNMVIAKELGLGVGEVKLVIDLFKGMSS